MTKTKLILVSVVASGALLLTGCGETLNFYSSLQSAAEIKNFTYKSEFNVSDTMSGEYIGVAIDGSCFEEADFYTMNISFKGNIKATEDTEAIEQPEFKPVTDIILDGADVYINVKTILDLYPEAAMLTDSIGITSEYIMIPCGDVASDYTTEGTVDEKNIDGAQKAIADEFVKVVDKAEGLFADVKPQLISKDGNTYKFTLTKDSALAVIDILDTNLETFVVSFYDDAVEMATKSGASAEAIEDIKKSKEEIDEEAMTEAHNTLAEMKDTISKCEEMNLNLDSTLTGGKGSRNWALNGSSSAKDAEHAMEISFKHSVSEVAKPEKGTVPTDAYDLMAAISGMLEGFGSMGGDSDAEGDWALAEDDSNWGGPIVDDSEDFGLGDLGEGGAVDWQVGNDPDIKTWEWNTGSGND